MQIPAEGAWEPYANRFVPDMSDEALARTRARAKPLEMSNGLVVVPAMPCRELRPSQVGRSKKQSHRASGA